MSVIICATESELQSRQRGLKSVRPMHAFSSDELVLLQQGVLTQDDPLVVYAIEQRWLVGPSEGPYRLDNSDGQDYSEYGQTGLVDKLLRSKTKGFFVECGAGDGETGSNTLGLEIGRNWTGLLIEPNEYFYRHLLKKNRNVYSINACLSPKNSSTKMKFRPVGMMGGLDGMMDTIHEDYIKKDYHFQKDMMVQCFTLYSILAAIGRTHIDYLALDVEGPELEILQTIPFHKVSIDIISVEYRVWGGEVDVDATKRKLKNLRTFFMNIGGYQEVGVVPPIDKVRDTQNGEIQGVDVLFQKTYNTQAPHES